jgi:hypothetical protein
MLIRMNGENLGVTDARDESAAIAKDDVFNIGPERWNRIVLTRLDTKW